MGAQGRFASGIGRLASQSRQVGAARQASTYHRTNSTWQSRSRATLAAVGAISAASILALTLSRPKINCDDKPRFTKDEVTLLCLIGVPGAGKTTQAKKINERWPDFTVLSDINSAEKLIFRITRDQRPKPGQRNSYIVDGFPRTMEDVERVEKELVPVFCVVFNDLPKEKAEERFGKDSAAYKQWDKATKALEPVIKRYREEGNIIEISSDWDSADEVSDASASQRFESVLSDYFTSFPRCRCGSKLKQRPSRY